MNILIEATKAAERINEIINTPESGAFLISDEQMEIGFFKGNLRVERTFDKVEITVRFETDSLFLSTEADKDKVIASSLVSAEFYCYLMQMLGETMHVWKKHIHKRKNLIGKITETVSENSVVFKNAIVMNNFHIFQVGLNKEDDSFIAIAYDTEKQEVTLFQTNLLPTTVLDEIAEKLK